MDKLQTFGLVERYMAFQGQPCLDEHGWPAQCHGRLRSPSAALLTYTRPVNDLLVCVDLAVSEGHDRALVLDLELAHEMWANGDGAWNELLQGVKEGHDLD